MQILCIATGCQLPCGDTRRLIAQGKTRVNTPPQALMMKSRCPHPTDKFHTIPKHEVGLRRQGTLSSPLQLYRGADFGKGTGDLRHLRGYGMVHQLTSKGQETVLT